MKILIFFVIFSPAAVLAQFSFRGVLKDQQTGEPVPFAAVYTRAGQGTTSTTEGTFVLTVSHASDTVWVRSLGYQTTFFIAGKSSADLTIALVPAAFSTGEVVIRPPLATDILREVERRKFRNMPDSCYTFEIWFREYLREQGANLLFTEGHAAAMRLPPHLDLQTLSWMDRGRTRPRSASHLDLINLVFKDKNGDTLIDSRTGGYLRDGMDVYLSSPRWMKPSHFDHYTYDLQTDVFFRGRSAYHITITPIDNDLGRPPRTELWIDARSYAIMSLFSGADLSLTEGSSEALMEGLEGSWKAKAAIWVLLRGLTYQARAYQKRVDYRLTESGWVLEKASLFAWADIKRYGHTYALMYKQEVVCSSPTLNTALPGNQYRPDRVRPDTGPDTDGFWQHFYEILPE